MQVEFPSQRQVTLTEALNAYQRRSASQTSACGKSAAVLACRAYARVDMAQRRSNTGAGEQQATFLMLDLGP